MTLSPRDDEPDDHASRAGAPDDPSQPTQPTRPLGADGETTDAGRPDDAGRDDDVAADVPDVPDVPAGDDAGDPGDTAAREAAQQAAEAAAWEAIVANYGEAPTWEEPRSAPHPDHPAGRGRRPEPPAEREPAATGASYGGPEEAEPDVAKGPDDRFVPPPPPPLPRTSPARGLAWFGLLGVPTLVLVLLVAGVSFPSWVTFGFAAWFVSGFGFLVATMRSDGSGTDGPDDGAVV